MNMMDCISSDKKKDKKIFTAKQSKILGQKRRMSLFDVRYFEEIIVSWR